MLCIRDSLSTRAAAAAAEEPSSCKFRVAGMEVRAENEMNYLMFI